MIHKILLICSVIFFCWLNQLAAQTDNPVQQGIQGESVAAIPAKKLQAQPGTYQFFILGEDSTQLLRTDLAEKIESYRDETAVVHLRVSSTTIIRILPCSEITSTHFTPLTKQVIFQVDQREQQAKR